MELNTMTPEEKKQMEKHDETACPACNRQFDLNKPCLSDALKSTPQPSQSPEMGKWKLIGSNPDFAFISTPVGEVNSTNEHREIAARIVECVNFCDGLPRFVMEKGTAKSWLESAGKSENELCRKVLDQKEELTSLKSKFAKAEEATNEWKQICRNRDDTINRQSEEWISLKTEQSRLYDKLTLAQSQIPQRILPPFTPEKMPTGFCLVTSSKFRSPIFGTMEEILSDKITVRSSEWLLACMLYEDILSITIIPEISEET